MAIKSSIVMTTRTSDLDSLRHVNNRIYEQLCSDGRYKLLEEQGYSIETLLDRGAVALCPLASYVKFSVQQKSGSSLSIETEAFPANRGVIFWNHHISQADGKTVCHLQAMTKMQDRSLNPVDLLTKAEADSAQVLIEDVPMFSGTCDRVASAYSVIYTDMDAFGNIPIAGWWRIFEEGRHHFGERLGLSVDRLVQFDTHFFWLAGTYQYYQSVMAGQPVSILTWLERVARIRAYIRQEVRTADGARLLGASREEHVIVSLGSGRPRALPLEMANMMQAYVEKQD